MIFSLLYELNWNMRFPAQTQGTVKPSRRGEYEVRSKTRRNAMLLVSSLGCEVTPPPKGPNILVIFYTYAQNPKCPVGHDGCYRAPQTTTPSTTKPPNSSTTTCMISYWQRRSKGRYGSRLCICIRTTIQILDGALLSPSSSSLPSPSPEGDGECAVFGLFILNVLI